MEVVREERLWARAGAGEEHAGGGTERLPIGGGKVDWGSSVARAPARALNGIRLSGREWSRTMNLELREQPPSFDAQYGAIPIAFEVREHLAVELVGNGFGGIRLTRCPVEAFYTKDYDAMPGQRPQDWAKQWDLTKWCLCAAFSDEEHVGSVAIIFDTAQMYGSLSHGAEAVVWDIRVRPDYRHRGVGSQLLAFAEGRARSAGKQRLSVETQNNNVAACRLYASAGFELRSFDRFAYSLLPNEVQLVWSKQVLA